MKILHVLDDYSNRSGHSTVYIIEGIKQLGHEAEVYTSNVRLSALEPDDSKSLVKITRFKGIKIFKKAFFPGVIPKILFMTNPDIVHTYVMGYFSTFLTGYLKPLKKYNLVVFADIDRDVKHHKGILGKMYFNFFLKWPIKQADLIHVFTSEQKTILVDRTGIDPNKIFVWPSGVDTSKFARNFDKNKLRKSFGMPNKFIILNVSSIVRKRRLELILEAIKDLDVYFVHVGAEVDKDYYRYLLNKVDELGINDKVKFFGKKYFDELVDFYLASDIFVLSSSNESFGIPMLEAMAAGLPIITTDVGAARDLIEEGKNGFIVDAEDLNKILSRVKKLNLKEMGNVSKEKSKDYDWNILIPRLEAKYYELIRK